MRRLYEFKCTSGHIDEEYVDETVREGICSLCEQPTLRIISPVRSELDPICGDFQKATDDWTKKRKQRMGIEQKAIRNHGPDAAWDVSKGT